LDEVSKKPSEQMARITHSHSSSRLNLERYRDCPKALILARKRGIKKDKSETRRATKERSE